MANIFGGFIMARLTRTQKFAALREELANSSEQTTVNNDLNKYQDKLNSLQSASNKETQEKKEEFDVSVEPLPTYNEVKEEVKEEEKKVENDFFADFNLDSINEAIDKIVKQNVEIIDNSDNNDNKVEEVEPVVEEVKPVEVENINSLIDETLDKLTEVIGEIEEKVEPEVEVELVAEEEPIVVPERIEEPYNYIEQDYADIAELLKKEVLELNGPVEPVKEEEVTAEPEIIVPERIEEPYNYIEQDYADIAELLKKEVLELNGPVEPVKEEEEVIVEPELQELTNLDTLIDGLVVEEEIALPNLDIPEANEIVEEEPNVESEIVLPDLDIPEVDELIEEPSVEEVPELVEQPIASENVALPEVDASKIDEPVVEEPSVDPSDVDVNSLLDKTLEEVADYNTQAGRLTVDENLNSLIEDVRHGGFNDDEEDDDFSNTVTLEIDKVLSEINLEPVTGLTVSLDEVLDNTVEVDPIDAKREKAAEKLADTLTHPVLTKTLEESPVEIKTLDETFTKDLSTTATLSFKKNEIAEDDDEDYYYDDDKPNKVLNVVLIVLLVIFLIIVGVIVYFLLLAKGIL